MENQPPGLIGPIVAVKPPRKSMSTPCEYVLRRGTRRGLACGLACRGKAMIGGVEQSRCCYHTPRARAFNHQCAVRVYQVKRVARLAARVAAPLEPLAATI